MQTKQIIEKDEFVLSMTELCQLGGLLTPVYLVPSSSEGYCILRRRKSSNTAVDRSILR